MKTIHQITGCIKIICAVAVLEKNRYLLVQEGEPKVRGKWNFPSGNAHFNENIIEAAKREVKEETGFDIIITNLVSVHYLPWDDQEGLSIRFSFWGKRVDLQEKSGPLPNDILKVDWKTKDQIKDLLAKNKFRSIASARVAQEILNGQKYPLKALFTL
jgi:ADP-ribose pyrophosphatase YjhB (NUDIX family)